ncbi:unnamed protein product [Phytomonas sp. EM1]|nr:unnamed protein product [Phytomonas sp. EM1]|eukprot:CCW63141.1 unnamed protein product [Phytomonas sp. isolate EM1]
MASWLRLTDDEIKQRSDHLMQTSLHMYLKHDTTLSPSAVLVDLLTSPLRMVSSGFQCCDRMLREANVGTSHSGGFPTGTLTEFYGASLSGKSYILQYVARSFIQKMLSMQQLYETQNRLNKEESYVPKKEKQQKFRRIHSIESKAATAYSRSTKKYIAEFLEWDVYICLSTSQLPESSTQATQGCGQNWWNLLTEQSAWGPEKISYVNEHIHVVTMHHPNDLLDFLSFLDKQLQVGFIKAHDQDKHKKQRHHSSAENASLRGVSAYGTCTGERSTDYCSVHQFNADKRESRETSTGWDSTLHTCGYSPDKATNSNTEYSPMQPQSQKSNETNTSVHFSQNRCSEKTANFQPVVDEECADAKNVEMSPRSPNCEEGTEASLHTSYERYTCCWRQQRRKKSVLVLIDSLSWVWQHPALQSSADLGNTHPMNWYAAELHRLLRVCLQPRFVTLGPKPEEMKSESSPILHNEIQEIITTAIVANGCTLQGPFGRTPPYLENSGAPLTDESTGFKKSSNAVHASKIHLMPQAKPLGKEAWWAAPDYRIFLEVVDSRALGDSAVGAINVKKPSFDKDMNKKSNEHSISRGSFNDGISDAYHDDGNSRSYEKITLGHTNGKPRFRSRLYLVKGGSTHATCMMPYMDKYQ